jgi:hypothetical protein
MAEVALKVAELRRSRVSFTSCQLYLLFREPRRFDFQRRKGYMRPIVLVLLCKCIFLVENA